MVDVEGTTIIMTRGDTFRCIVKIVDKEGNEVFPEDDDRVVFTAKARYRDTIPLIEKTIPINTMVLEIEPQDTKRLKMPCDYVYDIQLICADGSVHTFIDRSILRLTEEVG